MWEYYFQFCTIGYGSLMDILRAERKRFMVSGYIWQGHTSIKHLIIFIVLITTNCVKFSSSFNTLCFHISTKVFIPRNDRHKCYECAIYSSFPSSVIQISLLFTNQFISPLQHWNGRISVQNVRSFYKGLLVFNVSFSHCYKR